MKSQFKIISTISLLLMALFVSCQARANFFKLKLNEVVSYQVIDDNSLQLLTSRKANLKSPSLKFLKDNDGLNVLIVDFNNLRFLGKPKVINLNNSKLVKITLANLEFNNSCRLTFSAKDLDFLKAFNFIAKPGMLNVIWPQESVLKINNSDNLNISHVKVADKYLKSKSSALNTNLVKTAKPISLKANQVKIAKFGINSPTVKPAIAKLNKFSAETTEGAQAFNSDNSTKTVVNNADHKLLSPSTNSLLALDVNNNDKNSSLKNDLVCVSASLNTINIISETKINCELKQLSSTKFNVVLSLPALITKNKVNPLIFKSISQNVKDKRILEIELAYPNIISTRKIISEGYSLEYNFEPKLVNLNSNLIGTDLDIYNNFVFKNTKSVVLDPGHGGNDPGAMRNDIMEKNLTLGIINELRHLLKSHNVSVVSTRINDDFVSLLDRVKLTNLINPDLFVSVHINSLDRDCDIQGIETYYCKDDSEDLAKTIHSNLLSNLATPNRQIRKAKFYVIKNTQIPSILAEVGFITSVDERSKLQSSEYQKLIAKSLALGIIKYLIATPEKIPIINQSNNLASLKTEIK